MWPSQRAFVGGVNDASTGLTHLGAREYDPSIGRFISVDPVFNAGDPQQLQGYSYANNTPITMSDPTGLEPCSWCKTGDEEADVAERRAKGGGGSSSSSSSSTPAGPSTENGGRGGNSSSSDQRASAAAAQQKADAAAKLAALTKARAAREAQKRQLIAAAKALMKIAADELGITAALDCLTSGNLGACAETAVNVISSFAGGLAGKLIAKYGLQWGKAARLAKTLFKLGDEAIGAIKGWYKAGKELAALEKDTKAAEGADDWTRVGRWMHPDEHAAMQETGNIQWNSVGTHRVANPATPDAYRAAPKGDVYVDYEVPTSVLRPHSEGTSIIYGPNSLQARLPGRAQPGDVPFRNMSGPQ